MGKLNVLVTGGAGYIGSHAVRRLLDAGHGVVVLDNLTHGHEAAVDRRAMLVRGDTGKAELVKEIVTNNRIDAVMHFAACIEVGESVKDPAKYYKNNFTQAEILIKAATDAGVRKFVFSSTAAVYGQPNYTPIDELHPTAPINPYGRTKLMVEWLLADFAAAYGIGHATLRYFNVAGASPDAALGEAHEPESHLIPRILAAAMGKSPSAHIFGNDYDTRDGTCIRDYVHVVDLVEAHLLALDAIEPGKGKTYNLGSEKGFSVLEVIEACRRVTGKAIPAEVHPRRAGDPAVLVAGSQKIQRDLGWKTKYPSLDDIVGHAWRWHTTHPSGYAGLSRR